MSCSWASATTGTRRRGRRGIPWSPWATTAPLVAVVGPFNGHRRMTLTPPVIDRARRVLWLVAGAEKAPILARLLAADPSIPASRVPRERALVLADEAAFAGRH